MSDKERLNKLAHQSEVTVWVGKKGLEPAVDELENQIANSEVVKVKFLRSARGKDDVEDLAEELEDRTGTGIVDVRGNTAVFTDT